MFTKLIPLKQSFVSLGIRRTTGYSQINEGLLPAPVRIGKRNTALPKEELDAIIGARVRGATDVELRQLVAQLIKARTFQS